jgi:non-heme chloroperoxidase
VVIFEQPALPNAHNLDGTSSQPIVFSHGWRLSAHDWDAPMMFFLNHGYRVIAHDRRRHGRSTQTGDCHEMDHYADDLASLTAHLDLGTRSTLAIRPAAAR